MGSIFGEKITRLIEYATKKALPLIIVCVSGVVNKLIFNN